MSSRNLYANQESAIRASCGLSGMFPAEKGVRQVCIGSHCFIIQFVHEEIRREVLGPLEPDEEALEFEGQFDLFSVVGTLEPDLRHA